MTDQHGEASLGAACVRRAWVAVALIPLFFFLAFALAQGLYTVMGYLPENDDAPLWVDMVCTVPSIAIFLVPCTAAVLYGWRANRVHDGRGIGALVIGLLAGLGFAVMSIVTIVASTLSGR